MPKTGSFARGIGVGLALFLASPVAFGAPAKRHKPKHATPAVHDTAPAAHDDAATAKASTQPDDAAPAKPAVDVPAKPSDQALASPADEAAPDATPPSAAHREVSLVSDLSLKPEPAEPSNRDEQALGRKEAARIAAGRSEVAVLVGIAIGNRRFTYSDPVGRLLAPYHLPAAPMASFGLEAYPLASSNVPGLRDLGFRGHISRAFAVNSNTPEGETIDTSWTRFGGELRERLLVPGSHPLEVGIAAGADASYFVMSTKAKVQALLPTARTISVRFGVDARILVAWRLSFMLGGAYLAVTSPGEIYDRFRSPRVGGVDGDLGFAVSLAPGLEGLLTGRYTRYFASFKPKLHDPAVAGGALDEQLQFGLGVRYAH